MTSSWISEKLWTSSRATAPVTAASADPPTASDDRRVTVGRTALPPSPSTSWPPGPGTGSLPKGGRPLPGDQESTDARRSRGREQLGQRRDESFAQPIHWLVHDVLRTRERYGEVLALGETCRLRSVEHPLNRRVD